MSFLGGAGEWRRPAPGRRHNDSSAGNQELSEPKRTGTTHVFGAQPRITGSRKSLSGGAENSYCPRGSAAHLTVLTGDPPGNCVGARGRGRAVHFRREDLSYATLNFSTISFRLAETMSPTRLKMLMGNLSRSGVPGSRPGEDDQQEPGRPSRNGPPSSTFNLLM